MSLLETIASQLARPLAREASLLGPFRASAKAAGSPFSLPVNFPLKIGDAVWIASAWGVLSPPAGATVEGLTLLLVDSGGVPLLALATPVATVISSLQGGVSLLFPPMPPVIFDDLSAWSNTSGGGFGNPQSQPLSVQLAVTSGGPLWGLQWGIKYFVVRGTQDG